MLANALIIGGIMHRGGARGSYKSFRKRSGQTHKLNRGGTRRGGIRL